MSREEANRFNVLDQHYFFDSAIALLGPQRKEFFRHYKFDVEPTTDDRPYFFDFFKWQALPELLERRTLGGAALLDWGYAVLGNARASVGAGFGLDPHTPPVARLS